MNYLKCICTLQVSFYLKSNICQYVSDFSGWSVPLHFSVWSKLQKVEDYFSGICAFVAGYERVKGYCRADFDTPEASTINVVKLKRIQKCALD